MFCLHLHKLADHIRSNIAVEDDDQYFYRNCMRIWNLTSQALPAMINLKHLFMFPSDAFFVVGCRFQLETLALECEEDSQDQLIDFVRTQRVLTHLQVGGYVVGFDLSWLTTDVLPTLTSIVCDIQSVGLLEHRRNIVALKLDSPVTAEEIADNSLVLDSIKYLSVWISLSSRSFSRPTARNLFLLEIQRWPFEVRRVFLVCCPLTNLSAPLSCLMENRCCFRSPPQHFPTCGS